MNSVPNIMLATVTKKYGALTAVDGVDLAVQAGECLALVGHNGAGKSTLIKMVLGLISPDGGQVRVMGQDPLSPGFKEVRRTIGFLPEQVLFQNNMTGRETLEFYARLKGASLKNQDDLFRRVDLLAAAENRISTYSKGMRQRLGLAQALIGTPALLILDEPTSGLDPASRRNVYGILNEMKLAGCAVLISSHALTELDDRIDRVAILNRGRLAALGTIPDLRRNMGLPTEIRIQAPAESLQLVAQHFKGKCRLNGVAQLDCATHEKLAFLKDLMALDIPLDNIEVRDPSLEQVFLAYSGQEGQGDE